MSTEEAAATAGNGVVADTTLWSVWIIGVDEYHASKSLGEARLHAHALNTAIMDRGGGANPHPYDPNVWAVPQVWPFEAKSHVEYLERNPDWRGKQKT